MIPPWWILLGLLFLRWWLASLPGYVPDVNAYKRWALRAGLDGIHTIYDGEGRDFDYPPLYAYLLAPVARFYDLVVPGAARARADTGIFTILVKIPPLTFDVLLALLLSLAVDRLGLWGAAGRHRFPPWLPGLLYMLHPAVLFDGGYWGQPDSVHTFFVFLATVLLIAKRPGWAWTAATLGCLMKPPAAPFLPLLAVLTLLCCRVRGLIRGAVAASGTALLVFSPFLLTGRGTLLASRLLGDVGLMAYTSVNAHNLWWLLGPWKPAKEPAVLGLTPMQLGLGVFGLLYALLLLALLLERGEDRRPSAWIAAAGAVAVTFFAFSTHMHENHLFSFIPFTVALAGRSKRWALIAAAAAITMLANMAFGDLYLAYRLFAHIGGASSYFHPDFKRNLSVFEFWLAKANSGLLLLVWLATVLGTAREIGLRIPSSHPPRPAR